MLLVEWLLEVGRNAESVRTVRPVHRLFPEDPVIIALSERAEEALRVERGE